MAQKIVSLPGIGDVVLAKRRGTRNLRLSVGADGRVRVGMPAWAPYQAGINFALNRSDWILKHRQTVHVSTLNDGLRIGKSYRLRFVTNPSATAARSRLVGQNIIITSSQSFSDSAVQKAAAAACERALKKDAEKLLPIRLRDLALKNGFSYKSVRVKKLRSRWGSCSSHQEITLNYYLIQLPWQLIDYVVLHELTHTDHLHHGPDFWARLTDLLPRVKELRKDIKNYRPALTPETLA